MMKTILRNLLLTTILAASTTVAAPAWVTDQFEITLRSGPSTGNAIRLEARSGMRLEVLERDSDSGYSRVRTPGGTEGWVLTRYLMSEPSAREQLETLTGQLTNANTRGTSLDSQLATVRNEYNGANRRIAALEEEKATAEGELADIRRTAANVLGINAENKKLRADLADSQIRVDTLEQENRALSGQSTRYWFMTGALVLVIGIILGLWLPRMKFRRRSGYDSF